MEHMVLGPGLVQWRASGKKGPVTHPGWVGWWLESLVGCKITLGNGLEHRRMKMVEEFKHTLLCRGEPETGLPGCGKSLG